MVTITGLSPKIMNSNALKSVTQNIANENRRYAKKGEPRVLNRDIMGQLMFMNGVLKALVGKIEAGMINTENAIQPKADAAVKIVATKIVSSLQRIEKNTSQTNKMLGQIVTNMRQSTTKNTIRPILGGVTRPGNDQQQQQQSPSKGPGFMSMLGAGLAGAGIMKAFGGVGKLFGGGIRLLKIAGPIGLIISSAFSVFQGISEAVKTFQQTGNWKDTLKNGIGKFFSSFFFDIFSKETAVNLMNKLGDFIDKYLLDPFKDLFKSIGDVVKDIQISALEVALNTLKWLNEKTGGFTEAIDNLMGKIHTLKSGEPLTLEDLHRQNPPRPEARPSESLPEGVAPAGNIRAAEARAREAIQQQGAERAQRVGGPTAPPSGLGDLSAKYESGGKTSVTNVDSGNWTKDRGNVSYGKYQIASGPGTFADFQRHAMQVDPEIGAILAQIPNGGVAKTQEEADRANEIWKKIANDPAMGSRLSKIEQEYIQKTHYDPAIQAAKSAGIDTENLSNAAKQALWSAGVQMGPGAVQKAVRDAAAQAGGDERKFIENLYEWRKKYQQEETGRFNREGTEALSRYDTEKANAVSPTTAAVAPSFPSATQIPMRPSNVGPAINEASENLVGTGSNGGNVTVIAPQTSTINQPRNSTIVTNPSPRNPDLSFGQGGRYSGYGTG